MRLFPLLDKESKNFLDQKKIRMAQDAEDLIYMEAKSLDT